MEHHVEPSDSFLQQPTRNFVIFFMDNLSKVSSDLMRIFSGWNIRDETLCTIEVNEHKGGKNEDANDSIASEGGLRAEIGHK